MAPRAAIPVFDGHNDTLPRFRGAAGAGAFLDGTEAGHVDLPRALAGGLCGGLFAVYVPNEDPASAARTVVPTADGWEMPMAEPLPHPYAERYARDVAAVVSSLEAATPAVRLATSARDLDAHLEAGILSVVLHLEGAEPIRPDLSNLVEWYETGVRSIGLVWSRPNAFGHGVPFRFPSSPDTGPGLTDPGRRLVQACEAMGIMVDLAHLNERGFWDVADVSTRPLVVSHACANALSATARNLTDGQLDAVGRSGGLVGVNFHVGDLRDDGRRDADAPISHIVRHIDYIAERVGIEHVAFGSDFDGATVPRALGDVSGLPRLLDALAAHGYDDDAIRRLAFANWFRTLRTAWAGGDEP